MKTPCASRIAAWIRREIRGAGASGAVIGLSGGVDSSVTAALCVHALGKRRVWGFLLPCHTAPAEIQDARLVARELGVRFRLHDLGPVYDSLVRLLPGLSALARANLKPRLRMLALYAHANSRNALVVGTGNKSELLAGYFTKYGDGGVDLLPIGNLYKRQVWELSRELGVPERIITKPPTAGLWEGQTDEGEMGITYRELDGILEALERRRRPSAPRALVRKVKRMLAVGLHKRTPVKMWVP